MIFKSLAIILLGYALGCIAVGYYLVRWSTGQDLRQIGSGATGGRNASRALGKSGAIITGVGDILKGMIAMWIALAFKLEPWVLACVMIAVLVGHIWPAQLGFRGGKGLSAAFGGVIVYDYRIALVVAVISISLFLFTRKNEFFFLLGIATAPVIGWLFHSPVEILIGLLILILLILYAHRENLAASFPFRPKEAS